MKKVLNRILNKFFRKAAFRGYSFPVVVSLLLHASLLLVLSTSWSVERQLNIVPPRNIKASLVEAVQPAPQPRPQPQVDDSARKAREAAERRRQEAIREERQRRQAEEKRQREIALRKEQEAREKAKKEEVARKERERQRAQEEERKRQQEAERQRRQREETLRRLEQERIQREQQEAAAQQAAEQAEKDAAEVRYYSELLNNLIVNNWNRPPSARNNMTALLQVTLSPFGDLLEVKLLEGSGSDSFDRSAVQAVQRAAPFPELKELDRRIFDANFRRFNFRFRPEDLVR